MLKKYITPIEKWLDEYALLTLSVFLLAFIPLYPKIPLADIIPGYIVRLRLEDIFVFLVAILWGSQALRKKVSWKTPLTASIGAYAIAGLLSVASGVLITQTIPVSTDDYIHLTKSLLHYFRYLEYFMLFFITFSAITTKKHLKIAIAALVSTLIFASLYGLGQKYLYWPVYSTMNREYSKGLRLILTPNARVQSTFGGHYDYAAYLVILMPITLALYHTATTKKTSAVLGITLIMGVWGIMASASRVSYGGYILACIFVLIILALKQRTYLKSLGWFTFNSIVFFVINGFMMVMVGQGLSERLLTILEAYPEAHRIYHSVNGVRKAIMYEHIPVALGLQDTPLGSGALFEKPEGVITIDELPLVERSPLDSSDERPIPADVNPDAPNDIKIVEITLPDGTTERTEKDNGERIYTPNADRFGLSMAIRLDTLWPQAIAGFKKNPLTGSGYATLTKENNEQFTEAESTDNNFLRTLGETGLLGFISFYGAMMVGLLFAIRLLLNTWEKSEDKLALALALGFIAGSSGLAINALFIDVYAASKVAFTYWGITGIVVAASLIYKPADQAIFPTKDEFTSTFSQLFNLLKLKK